MKIEDLKELNLTQILHIIEKLRLEKEHARICMEQANNRLNNLLLEIDNLRQVQAKNIIENKELKQIVRECFTSDRLEMAFGKKGFVDYILKHIFFYKVDRQGLEITKKMIEKYL